AVALAIVEPPGVFDIVVFATSVLGSAFVPAYICAVWWKKANTVGAISSMIVGTLASVISEVAGSTDGIGFDPMVLCIVCSTINMIVAQLLTLPTTPVLDHVTPAAEESSKAAPIHSHMVFAAATTSGTQPPVAQDEHWCLPHFKFDPSEAGIQNSRLQEDKLQ